MMIASDRFAPVTRRRKTGDPLAFVPQRAFGETDWVTLALNGCAQHLAPAILSGRPGRIANAVRAIAHAPTPGQLVDVIGAACDAALAEAYAVRDTRLISNVADARSIIASVVAEMRERDQREAIAPALLREMVDGYIQIVGLLNARLAERLDATGSLAVRIGSAMHQPPAALLDLEFAGRLHDIGALSSPGPARAADTFEAHPALGEAFLRRVAPLSHLAPIVRSHRERFDGRGYPDGLRGAEIPLASRIVCVAAAFIDLVTESPGNTALLPNAACHELTLAAGTRFDPDVVTAALHLLQFRRQTGRSA